MSLGPSVARRTMLGAGVLATAAWAVRFLTAEEKSRVRVGLVQPAADFLPLYLAAERTAPPTGLTLELVHFSGGAGVAQALASDSVDVAVASLSTAINLINAGQRVKVFYGGVYRADYEWWARSGIAAWSDLRGRTLGITSHGSLSDVLTRHVLRRQGLVVGRDVQLVPIGGASTALQALQAGRIDVAFLFSPFTWTAEKLGFRRLGTEAADVAEEWPKNLLIAKEAFLDAHHREVRALLRAYVAAIRLARVDRESAIQVLMARLAFERGTAQRAYEETVASLNERGRLPDKSMPVFWEIQLAAGEVTAPWPEARFLDRRFIDDFDGWAPPR